MGKIKENWKMPECNIGDYKPIAFFYKNGVVELDFLSEEEGDFLSEQDDSIEIEYPFVEDYKATQEQRKSGGGTYAKERAIAYKSLRKADIPKEEAKKAIKRADAYFENIGVKLDTETRIPQNRKKQ